MQNKKAAELDLFFPIWRFKSHIVFLSNQWSMDSSKLDEAEAKNISVID